MPKKNKQEIGGRENDDNEEEQLRDLLGLGKFSARKSYYPELQKKIKELQEEKEKYEQIFSDALSGIFQARLSGEILVANPAMILLCGYASQEQFLAITDVGKQLFADPDEKDHLLTTLRDQKSVIGFETRFKKWDGTIIDVSVNASLQISPTGDEYLECFVQNITEQKQAKEKIRKLNEELEQRVIMRTAQLEGVNKELQEFAYIVSHDLKAPLRAVNQLATWLKSDYADQLDETGKEYLRLIVARVKRLDSFINAILEYSRVGGMQEPQEDIHVTELVDDVIKSLTSPLHIRIVREHPLPVIRGSRIRIVQVFQNLISNAIKYMDKSQGLITIRCEEQEHTWLFSITDNGPGIEQQHHERIFQIFQTLQPRDKVESTGIGLTLVKKIVEMHGGKIWVESERGQGSTFYFTLPKDFENQKRKAAFAKKANTGFRCCS